MSGVVTVRLFSVLKERVGKAEVEIPAHEAEGVEQALNWLAGRFEAVRAYRPWIRVAVNRSYVSENVALHAGDEVALITPVSGG
ncbi:MAG: MoaD/ThiS family protein [Rhodothermales bacterium]|nr:MoaD/ThiS family protein [Rhodothermales bacterium]MBO6781534.1 MoaD/ThiS family protein [Rhodothermales bacterium]